jgi:hypothetical protein
MTRFSRETLPTDSRLSLLEGDMERLFGEDGETGIIGQIRSDISEIKQVVFKARYVLMGCFVAMMAMLVLSGSGTVSLQNILKLLSK